MHNTTTITLFTLFLLHAISAVAQEEGDWQLVWADEFTATAASCDTTQWNFEEGLRRNHELQWYRRENAYQRNGMLVIEATADSVSNPLFTHTADADWRHARRAAPCASASVNTRGKFSFTYGRLEVRARIPVAPGSWPAIWTLGEDPIPWPSCGEIDLMECYPINGERCLLANEAHGTDQPYQAVWNARHVPLAHFEAADAHWAERFHTWVMLWDEHHITLSVDGEELNSIDLTTTVNGSIGHGGNPFHRPQYVLLNLAIGGDNGGQPDFSRFPLRYEIDYVRVYQKKQNNSL